MNYPDSPFSIPDFERKTTERMAEYYRVGQRALDRLRPRYPTPGELDRTWALAQEAWKANPENPATVPKGPLTLQVVNDFYAKCDAICVNEPNYTDVNDLIRVVFAANNGAQFILSVLLSGHNHPSTGKIARTAGEMSIKALYTPEQIRAAHGGKDPSQMPRRALPDVGDVIRLAGHNGEEVETYRVKDRGSTAMKGEFYVVTPILEGDEDDDQEDIEIPTDEVEDRLQS